MTKTQSTTQNIAAINNDLEILKTHFPHCFDKNGAFDFEKFKKELQSNEMDFSKESYGMDWLGKSYARLLASDAAKTLLKEDREWNNRKENKDSQNLLLKGDNLEVLKHLSNAYHEQVKMIYIDPPYNTGSDGFVYEDDRKFEVKEFSKLAGVDEEQAKKILSFVNSKSNSHSAWLTFMYPRLYIAKQLLRDDGVIFVSIDDNEVAQLRILMDEIFGEENFVGNMIWQSRTSISNDDYISTNHNHTFIYSKNSVSLQFNGNMLNIKEYKNPDNDSRGPWKLVPIDANKEGGDTYYPIKNPITGIEYYPPNGRIWSVNEKVFNNLADDGRILFGMNGNSSPKKKLFLYERIDKGDTKTPSSLILDGGVTKDGTNEVFDLFGAKVFDYPKPTKLLIKLLMYGADKDSIILDFFAGSGTTGDAVMQLNAEDIGRRKYILAQLPEKINETKNSTAYHFVKNELGIAEPTIFDITRERLVRAAKKIQTEKKGDEKIKDIDFGFKVFETTPIWEDYDFQAEVFDAQSKLFDESKLTAEDIQILLTTWKTYDGIVLTQDLETIDLDGYTGYYFENKLYLMDTGFTIKHLKKLLEEIDNNKNFSPASIIVFGYHFESKSLREIAENVASYTNKKSVDIDFITRY